MIAVFLHVNVYSNTSTECADSDSNEKLIEKLSLTSEMSNLRKLSFLTVMIKSNLATMKKEGIELTAKDYTLYNETVKVAKTNYDKLVNENLDFKKLNANDREKVFKSAIQKNAQDDLKAIRSCFLSFQDVQDCFLDATIVGKVVFGTCVFVTGAGDIFVAIESAGSFVLTIEPVIEGELAFCTELAFISSVSSCIIAVQVDIIQCIADEFGISYNGN